MSDVIYSSELSEWQSLNVLSGIAVGTPMLIQNKSSGWFILQESDTKPADDNKSGTYISDMYKSYAIAETGSGDLEYWIRPTNYGVSLIINVQEGQ